MDEDGCPWALIMEDYFSRQPDVRVPDLHGDDVRTTPTLISFRNWLLEQIAATPDRTFVNATDGGILFGPGLRHAPLQEVLGDAPSIGQSVRERLAAAHRASAAARPSLRHDVDRLLSAATRKSPPLFTRWREFTLNTVTNEQIAASLAEGLPRL
jgi:hypothetical protein